jgi:ADP-heptose:LPS heptosyltransferase
MNNGFIAEVQKIAVLRALVLGDLLFSLPALKALHDTYPQAEIHYLGRKWLKDFLVGRVPGITKVHAFSPSPTDFEDLGFLIDPKEQEPFFRKMQQERYDLAFQLQGGGLNSNPFICRINAKVSIGSREKGAIALDRWVPYEYHQHEVVRQLDIVRLAGAKTSDLHPRLKVLESDLEAAAPFLQKINCPYIVFHTGARDIRRRWSSKNFALVADHLKQKLGVEIVLTGTEDVDGQKAAAVEMEMKETIFNFNGQLTLPALVGLLANAQLIISNDTGPMHLALALGTKTVGLFWEEYVIKSLPLTRTNFSPLIAWNRRCSMCGMFLDSQEVVRADPRVCMHEVSFIDSIPPEDVIRTAEIMLNQEYISVPPSEGSI